MAFNCAYSKSMCYSLLKKIPILLINRQSCRKIQSKDSCVIYIMCKDLLSHTSWRAGAVFILSHKRTEDLVICNMCHCIHLNCKSLLVLPFKEQSWDTRNASFHLFFPHLSMALSEAWTNGICETKSGSVAVGWVYCGKRRRGGGFPFKR